MTCIFLIFKPFSIIFIVSNSEIGHLNTPLTNLIDIFLYIKMNVVSLPCCKRLKMCFSKRVESLSKRQPMIQILSNIFGFVSLAVKFSFHHFCKHAVFIVTVCISFITHDTKQ